MRPRLIILAIAAVFLLPVVAAWAARSAGYAPARMIFTVTGLDSGQRVLAVPVRPGDAVLITSTHWRFGGRVEEGYRVQEDSALRLMAVITNRREIAEDYSQYRPAQQTSAGGPFTVTVPDHAVSELRLDVDAATQPLISIGQQSWPLYPAATGAVKVAVVTEGG